MFFEIWTFMPSSSDFNELMLHALYRLICKSDWNRIGKKSLNVQNVKSLSKNVFSLFYVFFNGFLFIFT